MGVLRLAIKPFTFTNLELFKNEFSIGGNYLLSIIGQRTKINDTYIIFWCPKFTAEGSLKIYHLSKSQNFNDSYSSCYDTETQYFFIWQFGGSQVLYLKAIWGQSPLVPSYG